MKITISGEAGAGKSTAAKLLARKMGYNHYSTGDFMREMAEDRKMDFFEFTKLAEKDRGIDEELDQRQIEIGRNEDDFVIDARLGYHFIPDSVKIYLDADFDERAKRIFSDMIRKEHNVSMDNTKENMKIRKNSEIKRYREYYRLNPFDKKKYDLVVDTTSLSPEEVVKKILEFISKL